MSSETGQYSKGEIAMAFFTAWIIGFGTMTGVAVFAAGKPNWQGLAAAALGGLVTASKDYRSLKRMPSVSNGTQPPFPPEKTL